MDDQDSRDKTTRRHGPGVGRRDLMKLGAGVVLTGLQTGRVAAQRATSWPEGTSHAVATRAGYVYTANRLGHNGPMDDTSRKIARFVRQFSEADLKPPTVKALNRTMVDSMAALITGFEGESVRIAARLAARAQPVGPKCTILGYGITTTPELAAFANSCLVRHTDYNDHGPAGHASDLIPAALAIGEALHSTGPQVLAAITVGYEIRGADIGGNMESTAAAMAAGKLLGLDEDRLANAIAMALVPHVPLNKGVGAYGMWKGVRSAEAVKNGVWAALMASEGMTGPPQPFEGRGSLWTGTGGNRDFKLPRLPRLCIERMGFKRFPAEASSQACIELIPDMRKWTRPEEIASIKYELSFGNWEEIADNPKFDPRNREMADHSMPYILARALLDGDIYLDSFTEQKYMDPAARALMARMSFHPVTGWDGNGPARITIRKTNGDVRTWDTKGGRRTRYVNEREMDGSDAFNTPMTDEEITRKFNRACAHMQVNETQRDRARAVWGNIMAVKDIGEAMQTLAKFGNPKPL